jgi:hypothetical protein
VRRFVKVVVWTLVFAACAGVGAFVAAHTNPFPPGVEDPGARPGGGASSPTGPPASPEPGGGSWLARIDARTYHDLFVGGRCAASWRVDVGIAAADGPIDGAGAATIKGGLRCAEPTAQVQAERIDLRAVGAWRAGELRFRLEESGRSPDGSQELSGFVDTILTLRFQMPARDGASAPIDIELPDGGQGTYGAVGTIVLSEAR